MATERVTATEWAATAAPQSIEADPRGLLVVDQRDAVAFLSVRDVDPDRPLPALPDLVPAGFYAADVEPVPPPLAAQTAQARRTLWQGFLMWTADRLGRVPTAAEARREQRLDWLLSRLQEGGRLYRCQVTLGLGTPGGVGEDPAAVRARAVRIRDGLAERLRAAGYLPQIFAFIPLEAYRSLFPHGPRHGAGYFFRVDEGVEPLLPVPTPVSPPRPEAVYLGESEVGAVFFSPTDGIWGLPLPHGTVVILGEMGSRKTTLRRIIAFGRSLCWGRAVLVLDPKGEDGELTEAVGGRRFRLEPPADPERCWLHPFVGLRTAEAVFHAVRTFWSAVVRAPWPPEGDAVLNRVVLALAEEGRLDDGRLRLKAIAEAFAREGARSPTASTMAAMLAPYAEGGALSGYFDRPAAELDRFEVAPGDWIVFDLSGIRDEGTRSIAMYAVTWFLYRAVLSRGRLPLDVFIDEGWRLFAMGSRLADELARELRGRGGTLVLATHLPRDLEGTVLGSMAAFAFVGRMPEAMAAAFLEGMGVPEAARWAREAPGLAPGTFIATAAGGRGRPIRLRLRIPPAWLELFRRGELR